MLYRDCTLYTYLVRMCHNKSSLIQEVMVDIRDNEVCYKGTALYIPTWLECVTIRVL